MPARKAPTQRLIEEIAKRSVSPPRLRLELGRHVFVECHRRSHIMMLCERHHDDNAGPHPISAGSQVAIGGSESSRTNSSRLITM